MECVVLNPLPIWCRLPPAFGDLFAIAFGAVNGCEATADYYPIHLRLRRNGIILARAGKES
jgi:hypothetical protein